MAVSLDQFTQRLVASGLMSSDDVSAALASVRAEELPQEAEELARLLVRQQKLTAFQVQQIYAGKGKSLVLGNYVVLDKLGQGGMGMVLKAEHRRMKRVVALKVLSPAVTETPEMTRRFQREVEAAAKLEHPNIVTAHDADEANGTHFLVMQYVEGIDLAALVQGQGPLPVEKAIACVVQAARGLEYAHQCGVVHRDIKPANLLLDRKGTIKILDLGLARLDSAGGEQDQLTGTGQIMGTVDYMAPEQAMDTRTADARADIYSLGVTLWYLLTGRAVYEGDTVVKKLMAHQNKPIPSLCSVCPQASPGLDAVFTKMIAKAPESRYQSMTEVIAALERYVATSGSISALSIAPAAGDDSRLGQFFGGIDSSVGPTLAIRNGAVQSSATASAVQPTLMMQSEVGTDPQTQQLLTSPLAAQPPQRGQTAWRVGLSAIAVVCAVLVLWAAVAFRGPAKQGVIRVEIADAEIEVTVRGTDIVWKQADHGKDVKLPPGVKTLLVRRGDFQLETDTLDLKTGDEVSIRVQLLAGHVEVREGKNLLGRAKLPSGWHGWPADAPPPAVAPFDAQQATQHQASWAKYLDVPVEYTNSLGMKFNLIPPGEFTMGSPPEEIEAALKAVSEAQGFQKFIHSEGPPHQIILTQPIYLGVHEVTQQQSLDLMGQNPSYYAAAGAGKDDVAGADTMGHPVQSVSWNDAAEFCTKLSEKERLLPFYSRTEENVAFLPGTGYRLPTEAEWEYACRAGTPTRFWNTDHDAELASAGWFNAARPHTVGELQGNPFGLFDVHGNVLEWCQDAWEPAYYNQFRDQPAINPNGPSSDSIQRIVRGGAAHSTAAECRAAGRLAFNAPGRLALSGFRLALAVRGSQGQSVAP